MAAIVQQSAGQRSEYFEQELRRAIVYGTLWNSLKETGAFNLELRPRDDVIRYRDLQLLLL
jgi:hypothetical protein